MSSILDHVKAFLLRRIPILRDRFLNDTEETDSENLQPRKRRISCEEYELPAKKRTVKQSNPAMNQEASKGKSLQPEVVTLNEDDDDNEVVCIKDTLPPDQDVQILSCKSSNTTKIGKFKKKRLLRPLLTKRKFRATYDLFFPSNTASQVRLRDTGQRIEEHDRFSEILRVYEGYQTPSLSGNAAPLSGIQTIFRTPRSLPSSRSVTTVCSRPHHYSSVLSAEESFIHKRDLLLKSPFSRTTPKDSTAPWLRSRVTQEATPGPSSRRVTYGSIPGLSSRGTHEAAAEPDSTEKPESTSKVVSEPQGFHVVNVKSDDESEEEVTGASANSPKTPIHNEEWVRKLIEENGKSARERQWKIEKAKMEEELYKNNSDALHYSVHEKLMKVLKITHVPEPVEEEEEEEVVEELPRLPELTPQMEREIDQALRPSPPHQTLVEAFNISIKRKDMETLTSLNWLNDEIINYYFTMIMERGKQEKYPSVYVTNTFFYSRLRDKGHAGVKRWTRKVDIFSYELMLIPVHLGCHWTLASIDMKEKTISYYDSMLGNNHDCLTALMSYLQDEMEDKQSKTLDDSKWVLTIVKDIPRQLNGSDCGMFTCKFAEYISRRAPITFSQKHMSLFRRLMVYEILHTKILLHPGQ